MGKILGRASKPYAKVQWRGVTVDQRTKSTRTTTTERQGKSRAE